MAPTVLLNDEVSVAGGVYKSVQDIKRWDVIVFRYSSRYQEHNFAEPDQPIQTYVKRVVGLPGETLTYSASEVLVDGEPLQIPEALRFLGTLHSSELPGLNRTEVVTIPEDSIFIVGDNVHHSRDSRIFGPVVFGDVVGKVTKVNGKTLARDSEILVTSSIQQ